MVPICSYLAEPGGNSKRRITNEIPMTNLEGNPTDKGRDPKPLVADRSFFIHHSSFIISLVFLSLLASAKSAPTSDLTPLFDRWYATQTNLQSWSADFTQTR